jgi:transaldolase
MHAHDDPDRLAEKVRDFVLEGFQPHYGELESRFSSNPLWRRLGELGTELWLDTGSIDDAAKLWTGEMAALTTNNSLLNKEVQKGTHDDLIVRAGGMLEEFGLSARQLKLEMAFILNAHHALRLVERFDAMISVEEHTDLAGDVEQSVWYARRYHDICPERFYVKIPFTPAGLLATRKVAGERIAVNHTLGFSARQNYVISRVATPAFVNVFMGRLNAFVADNALGDGRYVGERATVASQGTLRLLHQTHGVTTRQIGASFRDGEQVRDLAGLDVMTMPPKVASQFLDLGLTAEQIDDRTAVQYHPTFAEGVDPSSFQAETLWEVGDDLIACVDALEREDLEHCTTDDLLSFFAGRGCGDFLVRWTDEQIATSAAEGKIPRLDNWKTLLKGGSIGLDSLMNLAGLNSFTADQRQMDDRVAAVLSRQ